MSVDEFSDEAKKWIETAQDARWKRPYTALTYQPMQEVLQYLRDNGYKTYIVTGGGQDCVRVYSERVYGIPPEQVVGTAGRTTYRYEKNGKVYAYAWSDGLVRSVTFKLNGGDVRRVVYGYYAGDAGREQPEVGGDRAMDRLGVGGGGNQVFRYHDVESVGDNQGLLWLVLEDAAYRQALYGLDVTGLDGVATGDLMAYADRQYTYDATDQGVPGQAQGRQVRDLLRLLPQGDSANGPEPLGGADDGDAPGRDGREILLQPREAGHPQAGARRRYGGENGKLNTKSLAFFKRSHVKKSIKFITTIWISFVAFMDILFFIIIRFTKFKIYIFMFLTNFNSNNTNIFFYIMDIRLCSPMECKVCINK